MKKLFYLLLILLAQIWASEELTEDLPSDVQKLIPTGYTVLDFTKGNLNLDKIDDAILILSHEDECEQTADVSPERILYILVGKDNGHYLIAAKNNKSVLSAADGGTAGDPFYGVTIKDGYFTVEHYGGSALRWTENITFKYDSKIKSWFLHTIVYESFPYSDPEKIERSVKSAENFGIVPFEKYDIFQ